MRLNSLWILKQSAKQEQPLVFELLEVTHNKDMILKKGNFNKPVIYGEKLFQETFIPIPADKGD